METSTVPLGNPRRIFARQTRRPLARRLPWLVMILCLAGVVQGYVAAKSERAVSEAARSWHKYTQQEIFWD